MHRPSSLAPSLRRRGSPASAGTRAQGRRPPLTGGAVARVALLLATTTCVAAGGGALATLSSRGCGVGGGRSAAPPCRRRLPGCRCSGPSPRGHDHLARRRPASARARSAFRGFCHPSPLSRSDRRKVHADGVPVRHGREHLHGQHQPRGSAGARVCPSAAATATVAAKAHGPYRTGPLRGTEQRSVGVTRRPPLLVPVRARQGLGCRSPRDALRARALSVVLCFVALSDLLCKKHFKPERFSGRRRSSSVVVKRAHTSAREQRRTLTSSITSLRARRLTSPTPAPLQHALRERAPSQAGILRCSR